MRLVVGILFNLLVAALFALAGFYYIRNAEKICNTFYETRQRLKPPLSYVLLPSRLYKSRAFVAMMRLGGFVFLACSGAIILWTIILPWFAH